jgi:predicted enzyme related to lactoylglutathione lyase
MADGDLAMACLALPSVFRERYELAYLHRGDTLSSAKEHMVAGLMAINEEKKQRNVSPCWTGYLAVPDTDAYVKKVVAAGRKLHRPAADIPGVGRLALVTDPHGAAFFLFTPIGSGAHTLGT